MTIEEAKENVSLPPEFIDILYDHSFEIFEYKEGEYEAYEGVMLPYQSIKVSVDLADKKTDVTIMWDNVNVWFRDAFYNAFRHYNIRKRVWKYISSDKHISLSDMEYVIKEGRKLQDTVYAVDDEIMKADDEMRKDEIRQREAKEKEDRLSKMTPEERRHEVLIEKVFNELSESIIFKTAFDRAYGRIHDETFTRQFEEWVENEVNWRVNLIEEREREENKSEDST